MATKVIYKRGTKETYLSLPSYDINTLYYCDDTHELFKGDHPYTDALRFVATYNDLPLVEFFKSIAPNENVEEVELAAIVKAADGKLYICEDTGNGYVLNATRTDWKQVIFGVDNETVEINETGLIAVKAIPLEKVTGLSDRLAHIEETVKYSADGMNYIGKLGSEDELPETANRNDLYELEDGSKKYWDGSEWIDWEDSTNITSTLSPVATASLNSSQLAIDENKQLNIVKVDANIVTYEEKPLDEILTEIKEEMDKVSKAIKWDEMDA